MIGKRLPVCHDEIANKFLRAIAAARDRFGASRVLNMDETSLKDIQLNGMTIVPMRDPCP
jgi:hypothetical protein